MTHNITHFIFDFDGVIADTETVFSAFDHALFCEVFEKAGITHDLSIADVRALAGHRTRKKLELAAAPYDINIAPYYTDYANKRNAARVDLFRDHSVSISHNLHEFLAQVQGRSALATNKDVVKLTRDTALMGLENLFDIVVPCDPPHRAKPAPDILLEAARRLDVDPQHCAYIGDNTIDMEAAISAKMLPIGFVINGVADNPAHADRLTNAGAVKVIDDMAALESYL